MGLIYCWDIWSYYSYRAPVADGPAREGGGEAAASAVGVGPGVAHGAVHDGCPRRVRQRGALQEPERRERRVVGAPPRQVVDVPLRRHPRDALSLSLSLSPHRRAAPRRTAAPRRAAPPSPSRARAKSEGSCSPPPLPLVRGAPEVR